MSPKCDEYIHALKTLNEALLTTINLEREINEQQNQKLMAIQKWAEELLGENYEAFHHTRMNMNMLDWIPLRKILEEDS